MAVKPMFMGGVFASVQYGMRTLNELNYQVSENEHVFLLLCVTLTATSFHNWNSVH